MQNYINCNKSIVIVQNNHLKPPKNVIWTVLKVEGRVLSGFKVQEPKPDLAKSWRTSTGLFPTPYRYAAPCCSPPAWVPNHPRHVQKLNENIIWFKFKWMIIRECVQLDLEISLNISKSWLDICRKTHIFIENQMLAPTTFCQNEN